MSKHLSRKKLKKSRSEQMQLVNEASAGRKASKQSPMRKEAQRTQMNENTRRYLNLNKYSSVTFSEQDDFAISE